VQTGGDIARKPPSRSKRKGYAPVHVGEPAGPQVFFDNECARSGNLADDINISANSMCRTLDIATIRLTHAGKVWGLRTMNSYARDTAVLAEILRAIATRD